MPLPRPLLLALLGAVLVAAAFFASRGLSGTPADSSPEVAPAPGAGTGAPATPERPAATTDIRQALRGSQPVKSGSFDFRFAAGALTLTAEGRFESRGLAAAPRFEIDLRARREGRTIEAGAISDGKRGYLVSDDRATPVAAKTWDALVQARTQRAERGPSSDDFNDYSQKELDSFRFEGREQVEGTPVLHFAGRVDPAHAKDGFADIARAFERTGLSTPLPGTLARTVEGGTIDVWVGAEDHVVHRERVVFRHSGGEATYELGRADLNQPQRISAPEDPRRDTQPPAGTDRDGLDLALTALATAVLVIEPAEARSEGAGRPQGRDRSEKGAERTAARDRAAQRNRERSRRPSRQVSTSPAAVRRAVARRNVVILFFRQQGADDDAVASAVNSVRGRNRVAAFVLPVGQAPKYADLGAADVVRAPTLVLLRRGDAPRIFEGFIDSTTLAQAVTDAR